MRLNRSLAVTAILGFGLLTGTAVAGTAYADATDARSIPAATASPHSSTGEEYGKTYGNAYLNTSRKDPGHGDKKNGGRSRVPASVSATVSPAKVSQGGSYTVSIATSGVKNGTTATVTGVDGKSSTVTVSKGEATAVLRVPRRTAPGAYEVTVTVGTLSDTADLTVVKERKHTPAKH
ncbi:hypothetical protein [Sphaerisporangium perillae]|uniref:hypothetical protein n=1 Tax=Sphaerisporangium perillae TaxID=2935860 RepID=UPI00200DB3C0|nr:hypothetical protein [Sphaerisporangium perillae]